MCIYCGIFGYSYFLELHGYMRNSTDYKHRRIEIFFTAIDRLCISAYSIHTMISIAIVSCTHHSLNWQSWFLKRITLY